MRRPTLLASALLAPVISRSAAGMRPRFARRTAAIGLAVLCFAGFSTSARGDAEDTLFAIAGGGVSAAVFGIACAIASNPRPSDVEDEFARRGWLAGAGGSYAIETFSDETESDLQRMFGPTASFTADDSLGIHGGAGYRCHRYFGADVDVEWISGFDGDAFIPDVGPAAIDTEAVVITANAKGYYPIGRFHPFLTLGAGAMWAKAKGSIMGVAASDDATSFTVRIGGGLDVYATRHIVVRLGVDYVHPLGDLQDLNYLSVNWGLQYHF